MTKTKDLAGTDYLIAQVHAVSTKGRFEPSDVDNFIDALKGLQSQLAEFEHAAEEERIRADMMEEENESHAYRISEFEEEVADAEKVRGNMIDECIRTLLKVRAAVRRHGDGAAKDDLDRVIRDRDPERRFA